MQEKLSSVTVINLFGGPGIGKSKLAARIFADLKEAHISCEFVQEYAKRKTWEKNHVALADQILVMAKQRHAMITAAQGVDVIVTDSPLILGIMYDDTDNTLLHQLIGQEFNRFVNLNFVLTRFGSYDPTGRNQTETEAREIDELTESLVEKYCDPSKTWAMPGIVESVPNIIKTLVDSSPSVRKSINDRYLRTKSWSQL